MSDIGDFEVPVNLSPNVERLKAELAKTKNLLVEVRVAFDKAQVQSALGRINVGSVKVKAEFDRSQVAAAAGKVTAKIDATVNPQKGPVKLKGEIDAPAPSVRLRSAERGVGTFADSERVRSVNRNLANFDAEAPSSPLRNNIDRNLEAEAKKQRDIKDKARQQELAAEQALKQQLLQEEIDFRAGVRALEAKEATERKALSSREEDPSVRKLRSTQQQLSQVDVSVKGSDSIKKTETDLKQIRSVLESLDRTELKGLGSEFDQARRKLKQFEAELKGVQREAEAPIRPRLLQRLLVGGGDRAATQQRRQRETLVRNALEAGGFGRDTEAARFVRSQTRLFGEGAAITAVFAAAVRGYVAAVSAYRQLAAEIREVGNAANISAESASTLLAITKQVGIDPDRTSRALLQFSKKVDEPQLKAFGFQVQLLNNGTVDLEKSLVAVADRYNAFTGNSTRQTELLFAAFGRQADTLVPLLERGADGIQELIDKARQRGEIFTDEDLQKAKEVDGALRSVNQALRAAGSRVIANSADELISAASGLEQILIRFPALLALVANAAKTAAGVVEGVASAANAASGGLLGGVAGAVGSGIGRVSDFAADQVINVAFKIDKESTAKVLGVTKEVQERTRAEALRNLTIIEETKGKADLRGELNSDFQSDNPVIRAAAQSLDLKTTLKIGIEEGQIDKIRESAANVEALAAAGDEVAKSQLPIFTAALAENTAALSKRLEQATIAGRNWESALDGSAKSLNELRSASDADAESLAAYASAVIDTTNAIIALKQARESLEERRINLANSQRELARTEADATPNSANQQVRALDAQITTIERQIEAEKRVDQQRKAAESAAKNIERAEKALSDARRELPRIAARIERAERDLARSRDDSGRLALQQQRAELSLVQARDQVADVGERIASSERSVRDARRNQLQSARDAARAEEDLVSTRRDASAELAIFNRFGGRAGQQANAIAAATDNLAEAQDRAKKAQSGLNKELGAFIKAGEDLSGVNDSFGTFLSKLERTAAAQSSATSAADDGRSERASQRSIRAAEIELANAQAGIGLTDPREFTRRIEDAETQAANARIAASDAIIATQRSEIELSRTRRDAALEAALGLADAENGIVDARRAIEDQALSIQDKEEAIADLRRSEAEQVEKIGELTNELADARKEAAELDENDRLESLKAQRQVLKDQIDAINDQREAEDLLIDQAAKRRDIEKEILEIRRAEAELAIQEAKAAGRPLTAADEARIRATANGTIGPDEVASSSRLSVDARGQVQVDPTVSVAELLEIKKDLAAQRASLDEERKLVAVNERTVELIKEQAARNPNDRDLQRRSRESQEQLAERKSTFGSDELAALREDGRKAFKVQLDLSDEIKRLEGQRKTGDSPEARNFNEGLDEQISKLEEQRQVAIATYQAILTLIGEIARTRTPANASPTAREHGGSVFAGQRIRFNEAGEETFRSNRRFTKLQGSERVEKFEESGWIYPANVHFPATTVLPTPGRTSTIVQAPNVSVTVPPQPRADNGLRIDNLVVTTPSMTSKGQAVDLAVAIRAALMGRR